MASKLALRTLGAIALPGAFLAVVAPTASAAEIAPLSHVNQGNAASSTDGNATAGHESVVPGTSGLLSDTSLSL